MSVPILLALGGDDAICFVLLILEKGEGQRPPRTMDFHGFLPLGVAVGQDSTDYYHHAAPQEHEPTVPDNSSSNNKNNAVMYSTAAASSRRRPVDAGALVVEQDTGADIIDDSSAAAAKKKRRELYVARFVYSAGVACSVSFVDKERCLLLLYLGMSFLSWYVVLGVLPSPPKHTYSTHLLFKAYTSQMLSIKPQRA